MLTVCRLGEILSPRRGLDSRRAHPLPNFKSGPRTVWLSSPARAIIDAIPRYGPDCPFLFPARPPTRQIQGIEYQWNRLRNEAGLPGLRIHDLRHYSRIRLIPDLTAEAGGERARWSLWLEEILGNISRIYWTCNDLSFRVRAHRKYPQNAIFEGAAHVHANANLPVHVRLVAVIPSVVKRCLAVAAVRRRSMSSTTLRASSPTP